LGVSIERRKNGPHFDLIVSPDQRLNARRMMVVRFFVTSVVLHVARVCWAEPAAGFRYDGGYSDLATALLAILAVLTVRVRFLFWPLVWVFNLVSPTLPALFWRYLLAFWLLLRSGCAPARSADALMSLATTE
jgi:hypothetical protein